MHAYIALNDFFWVLWFDSFLIFFLHFFNRLIFEVFLDFFGWFACFELVGKWGWFRVLIGDGECVVLIYDDLIGAFLGGSHSLFKYIG